MEKYIYIAGASTAIVPILSHLSKSYFGRGIKIPGVPLLAQPWYTKYKAYTMLSKHIGKMNLSRLKSRYTYLGGAACLMLLYQYPIYKQQGRRMVYADLARYFLDKLGMALVIKEVSQEGNGKKETDIKYSLQSKVLI